MNLGTKARIRLRGLPSYRTLRTVSIELDYIRWPTVKHKPHAINISRLISLHYILNTIKPISIKESQNGFRISNTQIQRLGINLDDTRVIYSLGYGSYEVLI